MQVSDKITLLNCDCMEYLATLPDKAFDLAICDPPYGIGVQLQRKNSARSTAKWSNPTAYEYKSFDDSCAPDDDYFDELFRVSNNQIIWGGNYFNLPVSPSWIVWDKKVDPKEHLSMCELAWSSFGGRLLKYDYLWAGFKKAEPEKRIHPTQKPIKLYEWLLTNYAKPGDRILDTHLGSGSSAIAAHYFGCDFVGTEIDADYYAAAVARFDSETRQIAMVIE